MTRPAVGVGVIISHEGKILLQLRKGAHGAGTWSIPGGHMEYGETPEQTAERETAEEVNVRIGNLKIVGVTNDLFPSESKQYITIFVEAQYMDGELRINEPERIAELRWCTWETLPQPLFTPLKNFIENKKCQQ